MTILQRTLRGDAVCLEKALVRVAKLDKEVGAAAGKEPYRMPAGGLRCFRG